MQKTKGDCYFIEGDLDRHFSYGDGLVGPEGNEGHTKQVSAGDCSRQRGSKWEHV